MTRETLKPDSEYEAPDRYGRPGRLRPDQTSRITRRITALAVAVGVFFAVGKLLIYQQTHSVGILSSLVHSALDLFGAVSSFIAVRYAARPPDAQYRFGRGKAESFSAVFQVCLIVFAAFHLLEEASERFITPEPVIHSGVAIAAMLAFIAVTTWLLIAQTWAIRATGSIAVRGDRAHYIADMIANVVVIIGIIVSTSTSFVRADALVGAVLALWLLWTAYKVARLAWAQLMDCELPEIERDLIIKLACEDAAVHAVHDLRTRASGPHIHIQMRLDMDDSLSLSEAHDIVIAAEKRIMTAYQSADILIHPHPVGCHDTHGNARFRSSEV